MIHYISCMLFLPLLAIVQGTLSVAWVLRYSHPATVVGRSIYCLFELCDFLADINECQVGTHNCHAAAECTNLNGSFYCTCNHGFLGNGTHCEGSCYKSSFH